MERFDPKAIDAKWQQAWEREGVFRTGTASPSSPYYCLEMLPYPSGKLHMGHVRNYSIGDAVARFHRMRGEQVMHVIGWDSFGLPAENAAIKHGEDPGAWTRRNIATMRDQLKRLGASYDWDREISTCEPEFYRWNQWFFLRMLDKGLAYRARRRLNWCGSCETVLANEQVAGGRCWRCDGPVTMREFEQWFLRITDYAQELLEELDSLERWPDKVRTMQRNWIGRSEGARAEFAVEGADLTLDVFTTRLDTIYGATYLAVAVEHPLVEELARHGGRAEAVGEFLSVQRGKSLEDRFSEEAEKLGVFTGCCALNPFSGERIPVWVANFVLMDVGTGAIMSVPGHDQRDFDFARAYGLPIRPVIQPSEGERLRAETMTEAYSGEGTVEDSGPYSGLPSAEARAKMANDAARGGFGSATVTYRLKDWGISRQRFWGTPIPVVHCERCSIVGVPDHELPVLLPERAPLGDAKGSPLARVEEFVKTTCPQCGGPARRDTDTMDTFVDSSWYYFRYLDPDNDGAPFGRQALQAWTPVDLYIGGIEHATMHLIYTRFWTKMMRDLGMLEIGEPVRRLFTQGMVIKDGVKMSKSKGNAVDPDTMIERFGADTTRLFCLFAAPPEKGLEWSEAGVEGCHRFLNRVWRVFGKLRGRLPEPGAEAAAGVDRDDALVLRRKTHDTIRRVTGDLGERMRLNTAVAAIMELINVAAPLADRADPPVLWAQREAFETLARLLSPFAPHFAEELWSALGESGFVSLARWPEADSALLVRDEVTVVVQVNGKLRGRVVVARGASEEETLDIARDDPRVATHLEGKALQRVIFVPDKLLNLVAR